MDKKEAINLLSDGHSFWYVKVAKEICEALKLKLPENLVRHYKSQKDANPTGHYKGLWLDKDEACSGVNSLSLSNWVISQLELEVESYIGRGFQAQANSRILAKHFKIKS